MRSVHIPEDVSHDGSGVSCRYFAMDGEEFAIKAYPWNNDEAVAAHAAQKICHKLGFAPAVGELVEVTFTDFRSNMERRTCYGYETERVDAMCSDTVDRHYTRFPGMEDEWAELERQCVAVGLNLDLNAKNVGILGKKLVLVDFGVDSGELKPEYQEQADAEAA